MKRIIISLLIILAFNACDSKSEAGRKTKETVYLEAPAMVMKEMPIHEKYDKEMATTDANDLNSAIPVERKVTKEGDISFETDDVKKTQSMIEETVRKMNGYVSNDKVNDYSERYEHILLVRIPEDKFDSLLVAITEHAEKIDQKNITVLDVTEEYIDMDSRLKTKKELEARYLELLKKASKVEEILSIETQIGILREEIESTEGRFRYLKSRISFSTLSITFYERTRHTFGFASKIKEAVKVGWENLLWVLIAIINLWPFILSGGAAIYLLILFRRKKNLK